MAEPALVHTPAKWVAGVRSHVSWKDIDVAYLSAHLGRIYQGGIYVVSQRLKDIFRPGLPEVALLPHGVDTTYFRSTRPPGEQAGKLKVGWAGNRASAVKGFEEFIAPLGDLPGVELVFCGYSDRLLNLAEMREFYDGIDVYVCTSANEGHNNSLMEAASMERAIVTTDVGTVPEFLLDGISALIVPRDVNAIQEAILRLRDNPELQNHLGIKARESVIEHFEWTLCQEGYRQFFRRALASAGASVPTVQGIEREAFLHEPDGGDTSWVQVLFSYLEAFQPEEPVALILLLEATPEGVLSPEAVQGVLFELLSRMGREAFPPVILVDQPEELIETLRDYDHIQWITPGPGTATPLEGPLGARFTSFLRAAVKGGRP
jgi:hypothetical protein